jgi:hypothetical protein
VVPATRQYGEECKQVLFVFNMKKKKKKKKTTTTTTTTTTTITTNTKKQQQQERIHIQSVEQQTPIDV